MSFNIGIIGTGYVGIVSGSTFAENGNNVICVDIDEKKIEKMKQGISPIFEPGLEKLLEHNIKEDRLKFTSNLFEGIKDSEIIFLCLPTPPDEDGSADLKYVMNTTRDIANLIKQNNLTDKKILVNKSTVPVGTAEKVNKILDEVLGENRNVFVCSNPEFLREGFAIEDALKPERVVIGTRESWVSEIMTNLYRPFLMQGNPIYIMDEKSAEVTKYAANSFLAVKISFMNDLSAYCEKVGADIDSIRLGIGSDTRIGKRFLFAGLGYGGSCFPKDVQALNYSSKEYDSPLLLVKSSEEINKLQGDRFFNKVYNHYKEDISGKKFAIWGLAFKPNTDDVREAPAFKLIDKLLEKKSIVNVFDQEALENTKEKYGDKVNYFTDMYEVLRDVDALIICTEWNVFRNPNFDKIKKLMKQNLIFDGRNVYDLAEMEKLNFTYYSIGRRIIGG